MGKTSNALKQSVELFAKNIFDDPVFQKNWQGYLDAFGKDIANIFGDSYRAKIGFASTAADHGVDNETCQVRNMTFIHDDNSEEQASHDVSDFYRQYQTLSKDDILALKKERQKAFIGYFARAFKPLGFKKKATKWTKALGNGRSLSFEAQKSAYSDQYYFNVSIHADDDFYKRDCYERVVLDKSDIYNWQLMSEEQTNNLIQFILKTHIEPKIENGGIV